MIALAAASHESAAESIAAAAICLGFLALLGFIFWLDRGR